MVNKSNKFNARKTTYNGVVYDSKKEAKRAFELDLLIKKGEIKKVETQPEFDIIINGMRVCKYKADFKVIYPDGKIVYEDVKGLKQGAAYQVFRLKKKLVKAVFGIDIIEK